MDPAIATSQVRVAVIGDGAAADIALPTKVPVRELVPRIRMILAGGSDEEEIPAAFYAEGLRPYTLRPVAGIPFSPAATLETLQVGEGDALMLCQLPAGPTAPPVVEDIADAAAIHSARQTAVFDPDTMLAPAAMASGLAVGAVVCGLAGYGAMRGYSGWAQIALGVTALVFIAATAVARRVGRIADAGRLGLAAVVPLGWALAASLPGPAVAPRVVFAAAGVTAWALLLVVIFNTELAALTTVVAVAAAVGVATAGRVIWHWPFLTVGVVLLAMSLLLAIQAPLMAPVLARFPFAYVPAPGENPPPALPLSEIEKLPKRAAATQSFQAGLIAASVILTVIGSVLVVWLPNRPSLVCWWLVVVFGVVTVLRMRLFDPAAPALWFLASPLATTAALTVSFAASGHLLAAVWAGGALVGLSGVLIAAAALKPKGMSIPRRGWLDAVENVLLWTILPSMIWLVGLVSMIRNRGPL